MKKKIVVSWELTSRCNMGCRYCRYPRKSIEPELTTEEIKSGIDRLSSFVSRISFFGGEPTLRNDLVEILKYAKNKIPKISLDTNGLFLDEDYVKKVFSTRIDRVALSLDSHFPEENDFMRKNGIKIKKTLDYLLKAPNKTKVVVSIVIHQKNIQSLPVFIDWLLGKGVDGIFFTVMQGGRNLVFFQKNTVDKAILLKTIGSIKKNKRVFCDETHINKMISYLNEQSPYEEVCLAGKDFFLIDASGYIFPCPCFSGRNKPLVNIKEIDVFREWKNGWLYEYQQIIRKENEEICSPCMCFYNYWGAKGRL